MPTRPRPLLSPHPRGYTTPQLIIISCSKPLTARPQHPHSWLTTHDRGRCEQLREPVRDGLRPRLHLCPLPRVRPGAGLLRPVLRQLRGRFEAVRTHVSGDLEP
jgi:hypothetical protein